MNTHQAIIDYVHSITGGIVALLPEHASNIIDIVKGQKTAYVAFFKYSGRAYVKHRVIPTTQAVIDERIKEAVKQTPVEGFYLFECYNSAGEFEGKIFTTNPNLF